MSLFSFGVQFIKKHPSMLNLTAAVHNILLGRNSIRLVGKENHIDKTGSYLKRVKIRIHGNRNRIIFQESVYAEHTNFTITGNDNVIVIGKKCLIKHGDFYIEDNNNNIEVGEGTSICGYTHLAATEGRQISIGQDCLFSTNVIIRTGDSHSILDMQGNRINQAADVSIGDHVWIGYDVKITKGVTIGAHSVVATGAIVTGSFENSPNCVLAGIPAKVIKNEINWDSNRV